jgi:uncharacterized membrane protein YphA (DoxX/SURF4 family)
MKLHQPIGDSVYGPLFLRIALSSYFILAGLAKLHDPLGFVQEVQRLGVVPPLAGTVYGIVLPYLEIFAGALCLLGLWTTLAGILMGGMLLSFIYALGVRPSAIMPFNKDLILFAIALSLLYTGPGAFSIDRFRANA